MSTASCFICCTIKKINSNKFSTASINESTQASIDTNTYGKKTNDINV